MGSIDVTMELTGTSGPHAAFVLTDQQVAAVGEGRKVFPVAVTVSEFTFHGRLARLGGRNLIGVNQSIRAEGELTPGATYEVTVALDDAPREVQVPEALASAPGDLRPAFDALSYTQRKEHARSVAEAKKDDTRERRIEKILGSLRA